MEALLSLTATVGSGKVDRLAPAAAPAERETQSPSVGAPAPRMDEYDHGEAPEPAGLYRLAHDETGAPKVVFDDPEGKPADGEAPQAAEQPEEERVTCNTDRVDAEIRRLKQKQADLQQQMAGAEGDPQRQQSLERQLKQVEDTLRVKDTDAYRKQHSVFS